MRDRQYRTYPDEFKRDALEQLKSSGKSAGQLERELGITPGLLLKWRDRSQPEAREDRSPWQEPVDLEAAKREIRRLQREIAEISEERRILKRLVTIFSQKCA